MTDKEKWIYIKEFIENVSNEIKPQLTKSSIDSVSHYLRHDEYEMAFEILFLGIMDLKDISNIDFLESKKVGKLLKLHEESVFDFDFWNKFEEFIRQ